MIIKKFLCTSVVTAAVVLLTTAAACSQSNGLATTRATKEKRNTLGITLSMRNYFDGSPFWQPRYPGIWLRWLNLGLGMQYTRVLHEKHGIGCSFSAVSMHYFDLQIRRGETFERAFLSLDAFYQYQLLASKKVVMHGTIGPNFRYGYESVFINRAGLEPFTEDYDLKDLGISVGIRGSLACLRNFVISPEIRSTTYLYRYMRHHIRFRDTFPSRPTVQTLALQLGLAYRF